MLFTYHWNVGAGPPPVVSAVKVTAVLSHTGMVVPDSMLTVGTTVEITDKVIVDEVTDCGCAHCSDEVKVTLTTSPLAGFALVYTGELLPTAMLFTVHW